MSFKLEQWILRLSLKLQLVAVAKLWSCGVTPRAGLPAGDTHIANALEKKRAAEIGVTCGWEKEGQQVLDLGRRISSHPEFPWSVFEPIRQKDTRRKRVTPDQQNQLVSRSSCIWGRPHLLWDHTDCRTRQSVFCQLSARALGAGALNAQCFGLPGLFVQNSAYL